ncbi:hypothetical protein BUALT_Bualt04G0050700 [Buddleja alternifolia]|uniref:Retrotransposon gag domain-containing protein n=1 Tax=Buddleja alternifolia TaxID=168488 RepID=A0AAV6XTZ8_9LAMI|nr:hypothetical protein BUALT_Bualt04G0050700 [Buddleja alternifolia]
MADPNALRDWILEMETRIRRALETTIFQALEKIDVLQKSVNEIPFFIEGRIVSMGEDLGVLTDVVDLKIDVINTKLSVLKRVVGGSKPDERPSSSKLKVPDPKPFGGARDTKELENFLWDMETYFLAEKISDSEKVLITSMYLAGDAKFWWRTRLPNDISANRQKIKTWDALKRAVRDYKKEFSSLMLDIREITEEDKLFNFMFGFQSWAQAEPRRQGVKDLPSAYAAADRLVDFRVIGGPNSEKKKSKDGGKDKGNNGKYGKDRKSKFKKAKDAASGSKPKESQPKIDRFRKGYFICGGDHRMHDCPKCSKLNALMAEDDDGGKDVALSRVNPLQLLSVIQGKSRNDKGLMYMKIIVNGKIVKVMIDMGATHNFVVEREIQKLGLDVSNHSSRIKAVNSEAKPIKGMATVDLGVFPSDDPGPCNNKNGCLSAMQVKKGLKHGETTYLAAIVEIKKDVFQEGRGPPAMAPYRMNPVELVELNIQLDVLLEAGLVRPSKAQHVFEKLREYKLYAKQEKCELCREEITFLGHIISQGKIKMDGKKVRAVAEWTAPSKVANLRSFFGLANYYRRFIKGYSKIVNPLTDLLKKDQKWEWTMKCQSAFDLLK